MMDPKITAKYEKLSHSDPQYIAYQTAVKIEGMAGKKADQHLIDKISNQVAKFTKGKDAEFLEKSWDNLSEDLAKSMVKNKTFGTNFRSGFHIATTELEKVMDKVGKVYGSKHNEFAKEKQLQQEFIQKYKEEEKNYSPAKPTTIVKPEPLKAPVDQAAQKGKQENKPALPSHFKIQTPKNFNKEGKKEIIAGNIKDKLDKFLAEMDKGKKNVEARGSYKHLEYNNHNYALPNSKAHQATTGHKTPTKTPPQPPQRGDSLKK